MNQFFTLTKFGIVCFVLFTAAGGYLIGQPMHRAIDLPQFFIFLLGLYCLSSGSFTMNQWQEREKDHLMDRTRKRPIPSGKVSPNLALATSLGLMTVGLVVLGSVSLKLVYLGVATVVMYNGLYTLWWKPTMAFAAVPGALPGAMPFVFGYTAASGLVFTLENFFFFMVMFLWQMPHFWALALKYQKDYAKADFPVLPLVIGYNSTLYYIGLYTFAYLALALTAPFFIEVGWLYFAIAMPFAFIVLLEFFRFVNDPDRKRWIQFFLWTTFSVLVFVLVPAVDRWSSWIF